MKVTVLTHATVIDATGGPALHDRTVLVREGRIATIGPPGQVPIPPDADVVDLTGRYVIPGLAEMHMHAAEDELIDLPLYLANGVTTVRQMWGNQYGFDVRRRIEAGEVLGPRWITAGGLIDGSPSLWSDIPGTARAVVVTNEAEARAAVRETKEAGADFVKVYSRLPRELYLVVLDEASKREIPVAGHVPDAVSLLEAAERGQRTVEHLHTVWPATSRISEEMQAAMARIDPEPGLYYTHWFQQIDPIEWEASGTYSAYRADRVFARLAANDMTVCPTLTMHRTLDIPGGVDVHDPRLAYLPAPMAAMWEFATDQLYSEGRTGDSDFRHRTLFQRRLETVRALDAAGARLIAGTDVLTAFVFPGFSLHEELELFVEAGLSPMRALQTATLEPARYLGMADTFGTVTEGKAADLVVLRANPLDDIRNTRAIDSVMVRGRLISSAERADLLVAAESHARVTEAAPA